MNLWVKLLVNFKEWKKDEVIELDDEKTLKSWLEAEIAEQAEAPETGELNASLKAAIAEMNESIGVMVKDAVAESLKTVTADIPKTIAGNLVTPAVPKDKDEEGKFGFKSFGEFAHNVRNSTQGMSEKLGSYADAVSKAPSGVNTISDAEGGYLVPEAFSAEFLERVYSEGELIRRTNQYTTAANSLKINGIDESSRATGSRQGGVRGYWLAEADQHTSSKPKFRQVEMNLHKVGVFVYVTDEQLDDSGFPFSSWLANAATKEMQFLIEDAIINGTGAGKPMGIINENATVSITKENQQAATTIVYENISKMWERMWSQSRSNAVWFINQDCEHQLRTMTLDVGTGGVPVYLPPGGANASPYGMLFNRPVIATEYQPTCGTVGDIVLADMSQYATLTKSQNAVKSAMSIHLRFDYEETAFRFCYRIDGKSLWHKALTPAKGTATKSPFITLATRS